MNNSIRRRVLDEGIYMIDTGKTIREIAFNFGVSKSTVHKDLTERLLELDKNIYLEVSKILQYHADIRHIRGGEATKQKFLLKNVN